MKTIINATTEAVTTEPFEVKYRNAVTLVANGLSSGEQIEIQIEYSDGNFTSVYNYDQTIIYLEQTKNVMPISAPGRYRLVKPATSAAVTIGMHEVVA